MASPQTIGVLLCSASAALAFPPAPYYSISGLVRDQVGQTIGGANAAVVLFKGSEEIGRTEITDNRLDQNYELRIRIDAALPTTNLYTTAALPAEGLYSLAVELDETLFYPIEASGNLTAGKGGERIRLDLNLGEDSDGDGLPDVWEQWQLYQAGYSPGPNGWQLDLLSKDGDFDSDGQTDGFEYITGTFAGDATEHFDLAIKEKNPDAVRFEFFAITGKTYTIESSTDLKSWTRIPFSVGESDETRSFRATAVGILPASALPAATSSEVYRLTVR